MAGRKKGQKPTRRNYSVLLEDDLYEKMKKLSQNTGLSQKAAFEHVMTAMLRDYPDEKLVAMARLAKTQSQITILEKRLTKLKNEAARPLLEKRLAKLTN